ncbi:pyruvoyl-dependent arginine decarboxylase [Haloplanus pelagicus]|jgi:arginine decarboxylase|uniref:pyruvoyl-dependent arginine decarboxylase n=1 Tax=Haloplanus pelagicus TaxID=2949995 RepID=UPI00203A48BC|nr:pyruvoyl-dependent arginine decarboxylase [Haloplanus sp. HW8-1]
MSDTIEVVWGHGDAGTPLSAFDAALAGAGIHNYNLVTYSSVIPPGRAVARTGRTEAAYGVGAPVGVVLAAAETTRPSDTVAAGLGWARAEEGGVLMESTAGSAEAVRADLREKLADARRLRDWNWEEERRLEVREHTVDRTGAVVVAAVYGPLAYAEDDAAPVR